MPGSPPGDQFVIVDVQAPEPKTDAQREAYARLADAFPEFAPRKS